ncbi:mpv17-like protein [Crassostrea virginica]
MTLLQTMATYATLWTISDLVEQKFICKKRKLDHQKSLRMFTTGTFVMAPLIHIWMFLVEKRFPGRTFKTVAQKMIAGQVVFAPFAISTFYFTTCMLEKKSLQQFKEEWLQKFPVTYKTGVMFWPFVQSVNFSLVPYKHRTKVMGCASFLWSMFLCYEKETSRYIAIDDQNLKEQS